MVDPDIADLLEVESKRINNVSFIDQDPVQFPRLFTDIRDIEIVALLSALIAWGNRKMICRDADRLLVLMDHQPFNYVVEGAYEDLDPAMNIHRTMFGRDLQWLMRGLNSIYKTYPSLDAFASSQRVGETDAPAWALVDKLNRITLDRNNDRKCPQCLPSNLATTALKRINMALRWLVRDDGIVDMGVWKSISKSKLYIPLDVHVGNTARNLGILQRKSNDRKAVVELTETLRTLDPADPARFDYALFGIGIESKIK